MTVLWKMRKRRKRKKKLVPSVYWRWWKERASLSVFLAVRTNSIIIASTFGSKNVGSSTSH